MARFLVDDILPARRVHLLAGLTDAGKTRWLLPALLGWERGEPILGRASHPVPWAYVVGDRTLEEAQDSMELMGIAPGTIRMIPAFGKHRKGSLLQILIAAVALQPVPQFLAIEGFGDLCGESKPEVYEFLSSASAYCEGTKEFPDGLTILGVVESPKQKPYERYRNPRSRVSGVSAWGYHSSTVMLIEDETGEFDTPERQMWVCTKNSPRFCVSGAFDKQGRLVFFRP